ncbi:DNA-binding transcriptional regulator CytR [Alicyclobacillus cellulosilyticus]|uniref:Catabolite control protein A n=1 Tax=Alicyclobacillus cellulosilyticus TaxID=1003997 RepID=A0A917K7D4_9BACL|nr:LacI family DNA-binding transcriptional regulator [Alicyclobacillus cellulosilyticus]GGJ03750.1 DNA-binding transcriptional regulator CytR [Alicyclobacillus cellulosilyticus]
MVRIKDIAKLANVSPATVSMVINNRGNISEATRKKVLKIIEELNYQPNNVARSLKTNRTRTIGVIVEDITVFSSPEIIHGINESADEHGMSILLTNLRVHRLIGNNFENFDRCKQSVMNAVEELLSRQVDGMIYIGIHNRDLTGLINIPKPVVFTYCSASGENQYSVNYDDELAAFEATEYLIQRGHEKIALISGLIDSIPSHDRFTGYYRAIREHGLPFNPVYVKTGDWEFESGYVMAKELLALADKPTAILAMNDLMAGGVLEACRECGVRVPEDLSVVGFDNREISFYFIPKLTTMGLPLNELGRKSVEILVRAIEGEPIPEKSVKLKCNLVERQSVMPVRDGLAIQ